MWTLNKQMFTKPFLPKWALYPILTRIPTVKSLTNSFQISEKYIKEIELIPDYYSAKTKAIRLQIITVFCLMCGIFLPTLPIFLRVKISPLFHIIIFALSFIIFFSFAIFFTLHSLQNINEADNIAENFLVENNLFKENKEYCYYLQLQFLLTKVDIQNSQDLNYLIDCLANFQIKPKSGWYGFESYFFLLFRIYNKAKKILSFGFLISVISIIYKVYSFLSNGKFSFTDIVSTTQEMTVELLKLLGIYLLIVIFILLLLLVVQLAYKKIILFFKHLSELLISKVIICLWNFIVLTENIKKHHFQKFQTFLKEGMTSLVMLKVNKFQEHDKSDGNLSPIKLDLGAFSSPNVSNKERNELISELRYLCAKLNQNNYLLRTLLSKYYKQNKTRLFG
ncbi:hypothetical protein OZX65_03700 [Leuconostocaceae bacterium ESL0723]|nr:hypothetical protein OZX65_03700 [Leuconostocaceae bacterium ESL0723]